MSGCIEWQGYRTPKGYGYRGRGGKHDYAHRAAYEEAHGPIPKGLMVLHRCDNPACMNPDHLFLGTAYDNAQDMKAKGRELRGLRQNGAFHQPWDIVCMRYDPRPQRVIAAEYGTDQSYVSNIKRRLVWQHVP